MANLKASCIDTKLGSMLAIADDVALHSLEFATKTNIKQKLEQFCSKTNHTVTFGTSKPIETIKSELNSYFSGKLKKFKTPLHIIGTKFQKLAWQELQRIPYGETRSYLDQACATGKKTAYRAVANANAANKFVIVIPCHRVINNNGKLGGYAGGVALKQQLLDLERLN